MHPAHLPLRIVEETEELLLACRCSSEAFRGWRMPPSNSSLVFPQQSEKWMWSSDLKLFCQLWWPPTRTFISRRSFAGRYCHIHSLRLCSIISSRFLQVTGKCGSVLVRLIPAPRGTGIVSAPVPKKLLQMSGVEDCYTSAVGQTATLGNFAKVCHCSTSLLPFHQLGRVHSLFQKEHLARSNNMRENEGRRMWREKLKFLFQTVAQR